jgi:hypothetical protein
MSSKRRIPSKKEVSMRQAQQKRNLGRYTKHLGMLPTKKLYEKSATLNWDERQKPVKFALEAYLKQQ